MDACHVFSLSCSLILLWKAAEVCTYILLCISKFTHYLILLILSFSLLFFLCKNGSTYFSQITTWSQLDYQNLSIATIDTSCNALRFLICRHSTSSKYLRKKSLALTLPLTLNPDGQFLLLCSETHHLGLINIFDHLSFS